METIKIESKEFFDWLAAQSDNREVNMWNNRSSDITRTECGCVMIEFAHERLPKGDYAAGVNAIWTREVTYRFDRSCIFPGFDFHNMGEIKRYFKKEIEEAN